MLAEELSKMKLPSARPAPRALSPSDKVRAQLRFVVQGGERLLFGRRIHDASSLFTALDRAGSGVVALSWVAEGLQRLDVSVSETDLQECLQALEGDVDEHVGRAEFLQWLGEVDSPKAAKSLEVNGEAAVCGTVATPSDSAAEERTAEEDEHTESYSSSEASSTSAASEEEEEEGNSEVAPAQPRHRLGSECTEERSMDEESFEARTAQLVTPGAEAPPPPGPVYAEPSEASEGTPRRGGDEDEAGGSSQDSDVRLLAETPTPMGKAHLKVLSAVPGVWHRLAQRKAVANEDWARHRFAQLTDGPGSYVAHDDLFSPELSDTLRDCLGASLPEDDTLDPLVNVAFSRADADEDGRLSEQEFIAFTWCLKRLAADADLEVEMALLSSSQVPLAASLSGPAETWRDVVLKARQQHRIWADMAFSIMDLAGRGRLSLEDLRRPALEHLLQQLPYQHLSDRKSLWPCVGFALWRSRSERRAGHRGITHGISQADFEAFTWQLVRMELDIDREVERLTETVSVYISQQG